MLELSSSGYPVHLSPGTSVQLELNSPLFDEDVIKGQFSYTFSVPAPPNGLVYGFPERPDRGDEPGAALPAELSLEGLPLLVGSQRVTSASPAKYGVSVQSGLSGAQLSERPLSSFAYGGLREVPRWVLRTEGGTSLQVPGLPLHANQVVANPGEYDYVFAPLRNEYVPDDSASVAPTDPLQFSEISGVNHWFNSPIPLGGLPAGGSYSYHTDFRVPGGLVGEPFQLLPPYCPFPRLRYVLQSIFEEGGLVVDQANWLPGELGELVIAGNAQLVDRGDEQTLRFSLADVLPALTVAQLLAALRQDLGVVVYVDPLTRRVRTAYLHERVAPGAAHVDLTAARAGYPEAAIEDVAGLTLTYGLDGNDALTNDLLDQQPAANLVLPPVATVADLPATDNIIGGNPQAGQVRLVQATDTYYVCAVSYRDAVSVTLTWTVLAPRLPSVPVLGGGDALAQALCYTLERPTRFDLDAASTVTMSVPAISQPPYRADQATVERSPALRLLFYNGLQPGSDGVSLYPQLSHQSLSGALSVRLTGQAGTYAQLLSTWLPVKLRAATYKQPLLLTALALAQLDLTRPLWLDGVAYLVRKLSATVPLRKPATLELVRL